jgi:hypothetical protein
MYLVTCKHYPNKISIWLNNTTIPSCPSYFIFYVKLLLTFKNYNPYKLLYY